MSNIGYYTVAREVENTIVIDRSKFICSMKGVVNENEAREYIETIRKRYSLANHHCYAYIADEKGLIQKFSDDSEPQGTAGLPMLEVLKSKRLYKTVAVVTRYFGGIKLGTGGLTRAYGGSVSECFNFAEILNMQPATLVKVSPDYDGYSRLLKVVSDENFCVLDTVFENCVIVKIAIKDGFYNTFVSRLNNAFNGKITLEKLGSDYYAFK